MNSFLENAARQITIALAQRQAQAALMAREQRLRDISEAAGEFICELDPDAKITFASDRITHVLGYTPAEVLGKTPFQFMPPEEIERTLSDLAERVRTRTGFRETEYVILNKAGNRVWLSTTGVPNLSADGKFLGFRTAALDITARKQAEEEISRMVEKLENAP